MADRLVDAWDESHASEASEAFVLTMLPQKCLASLSIWSVFVSPSL